MRDQGCMAHSPAITPAAFVPPCTCLYPGAHLSPTCSYPPCSPHTCSCLFIPFPVLIYAPSDSLMPLVLALCLFIPPCLPCTLLLPLHYHCCTCWSPSCKILPFVHGCSQAKCYITLGSSQGCGTGACPGLFELHTWNKFVFISINPLFWLLH